MNKIKIIPFEMIHLKAIDLREYEANLGFLKNLDEDYFKQMELQNNAHTILLDGVILACWGYNFMWKGVCELWTIPSKYIEENGQVYAKVTKQQFRKFEKIYNFHRIQMTTLADKAHIRWMKFLEFKREGILHKYSEHGDNFIMWARAI